MNLTTIPDVAALFMLVFARVGTMVMLMPGIGERAIFARARLGFALLLTLILLPIVSQSLPTPNAAFLGGPVIGFMIGEIAVGLMIGLSIRFVTSSLHVAGNVIAQQLGLSFAMQVDPGGTGQNASIGNFLTLFGVVMVFATDLHHLAIAAIHDSYRLMPPGAERTAGDAAMFALRAASRAFMIGIQVSAPFIAFGLIFNLGVGVLARLMPQLQVFFLALPATIMVGSMLLVATLAVIINVYLADLRDFLLQLTDR